MFKLKPLTPLSRIVHRIKWSEVTGITVPIIDMSFHTVFSAKGFFTVGTGPTHVTSLTAKHDVK